MNQQHPIEGLMRTALENIRDMVDVSTVIGEPIDAGSGLMMIPVCKVSCGFVAGGSEFLPSGATLRHSLRQKAPMTGRFCPSAAAPGPELAYLR